jgi:hypothetical protein
LSHHAGSYYSLYQISKSASLFLVLFGISLMMSQQEGNDFAAIIR